MCSVTQVIYLAEGIKVLDDFEVWRWITTATLPAKADRKCEYMSTNLAQIYGIAHTPRRRLNTPLRAYVIFRFRKPERQEMPCHRDHTKHFDFGLRKFKIVDKIGGSISNERCFVERREFCQICFPIPRKRGILGGVARFPKSLNYNV